VVAHESFKGNLATSRSNSIYLIQPPLLHVPNAFTKNQDLLNETWGFVPVFVKTYHMQVYNRWGEKVFDSIDKHQDWDGNYLEETKGIEVFIWQVTYTGWDRSSHYQKGTVTVIK
jgi:gliding motility-associated-like protein